MNLDSLRDQVSNLTLYDIKAGVRKVQNAVMNYTEMEAKVREATNNEPWGASSSVMQEIANGTHSYQLLNEIMPMIYKRFTDKTAEEWRQIYKALQLLEFLIKNGSERVIDDARSHLSLLRMLRQFHYIDQNGKDQGINVRNRAQELAKLLNDVDQIRAERKKARLNKNKYGGVEGGMGASGGMSGSGFSGGSGSRYGGFGSEDASFGGYSGGVYGDGGGFGGNTAASGETGSRSERFEEYDEYDEAPSSSSRRRRDETPPSSHATRVAKKAEPPKPQQPEQDLLFDDEPATISTSSVQPAQSQALPGFGNMNLTAAANDDDDDFDDFQSAAPAPTMGGSAGFATIIPPAAGPSITTQFAAPKPVLPSHGASLSDMVRKSSATPTLTSNNFGSPSPGPASVSNPLSSQTMQSQAPLQARPSGYQAKQPNYYTSVQVPSPLESQNSATSPAFTQQGSTSLFSPNTTASASTKSTAPKASNDVFGSLWSSASAGAGIQKANAAKGPNLASMAQAKSSAGIWGTGSPAATGSSTSRSGQKLGGGLDDMLG